MGASNLSRVLLLAHYPNIVYPSVRQSIGPSVHPSIRQTVRHLPPHSLGTEIFCPFGSSNLSGVLMVAMATTAKVVRTTSNSVVNNPMKISFEKNPTQSNAGPNFGVEDFFINAST